MWLWIVVGLGAFLALSLLVGLALAAMLGAISRGVSELHEEPLEPAAVGPPTRRLGSRPPRLDEVTAHSLWELEVRQP